MIVAHRTAVLELLEQTGNHVHDGAPPNLPPLPYVVLWSSGLRRVGSRWCGDQDDADMLFSTTVVAKTGADVARVQENVHAALVNAPVAVSGRSCQRVKHEDSQPADPDYDTDPPLITAVDVWRLISVPA